MIPERVISNQLCHPRGKNQGVLLCIHLENPYLGPIRDNGGMIIPPNSNQEAIPTHHQLVGVGQGCGSNQDHKGGHVHALVKQGPFGTRQAEDPSLAPYAKPLLLKIPPQIIQ